MRVVCENKQSVYYGPLERCAALLFLGFFSFGADAGGFFTG